MDTPQTLTPNRAGVALLAHIRATDGSIPNFCERTKLDRVQVQALCSGLRGKKISAKIAVAVERATDGVVPVAMWVDAPARRKRARRAR